MFKWVSYLCNSFKNRNYGNHVVADFTWDVSLDNLDEVIFATVVFDIMEKAIKRTSMTIVHKKLCILGSETSPPGFCSVILIDESHISAHCYSDKGWLALDAFTCGNTDPRKIMDFIIKELINVYPSLKCKYRKNHKRFHY